MRSGSTRRCTGDALAAAAATATGDSGDGNAAAGASAGATARLAEEAGATYFAAATAVGMNFVLMNLSKFGSSRICFFSCIN